MTRKPSPRSPIRRSARRSGAEAAATTCRRCSRTSGRISNSSSSSAARSARARFWAPYVYSAFPDSHDAFETLAVVADDVPLRASADATAPVLATLSRDLVTRAAPPTGEKTSWQHVKTADGKTGFVESKFVRSPVGYRAGFLKTSQGWRMNALVAGD